ncbi:6-phosphogluconate dehydratase [Aurantiacibacter atlanticus]|uniref:Phosphogluconate dehydratase n=1 Tax=Aurantiacibacter atlanticus TaxID=1648404 RepID=A0A0H4VX28_9SPHN|nr:phosphogluconate dehydratase [Aurantiacibacter atlanticus]AKQ41638.1 6-phosphogluconate dehydratase [Aurantiacibacter atlanticus]
MNPIVQSVTDRIADRSRRRREAYLDFIDREREAGTRRGSLSCSNLAHAFAASGADKQTLASARASNIAVVSAYNDMLSAHAPYYRYPEQIKVFAREVGATAQVAGGTPAMCDGVTQGQAGMELSLFSRDTIALATAVGLSHAMYDGALLLGICDKIVPGLLIGMLRFGHLPAILVPAGPMPSGLPNREKARIRELFAEGKVGHRELLEAESAAYHAPGTCTFYGTANSNQMMMEVMGLHVPGAAFVHPGTKLRQQFTRAAVHRMTEIGSDSDDYRPLGRCVDEKAIVNAAVGLLATGGSTNHTIHLPAIARAAGLEIDWSDFEELSTVVPLMARIYPNGAGDVNDFHSAGGMAYVVRELIGTGLLHKDVVTVWTSDLDAYAKQPVLVDEGLDWKAAPQESSDPEILRPARTPFSPDGGMRLLSGNLGRAVFKTSAVDPERWTIEAPVRIFSGQDEVVKAFEAGELDCDLIVIVRFQGPCANGMPELHKLMPPLGVLQDRGYKIALVTDGRMSGASGKVPSAIHLSPEALDGGPLAKLRDGDIVRLSAEEGLLSASVSEAEWNSRDPAIPPLQAPGLGRELFAMMRQNAGGAEKGSSAMLTLAGL